MKTLENIAPVYQAQAVSFSSIFAVYTLRMTTTTIITTTTTTTVS